AQRFSFNRSVSSIRREAMQPDDSDESGDCHHQYAHFRNDRYVRGPTRDSYTRLIALRGFMTTETPAVTPQAPVVETRRNVLSERVRAVPPSGIRKFFDVIATM